MRAFYPGVVVPVVGAKHAPLKKRSSANSSTVAGETTINSSSQHHHHHHDPLHDVAAGFGAGFLAVAIGYPMDVIKTRLQTTTQPTHASSSSSSSSGGGTLFSTGRQIIQREGFWGLYKGLASPLLTLSVSSSINFATSGFFQDVYGAQPTDWHGGNFLAGLSCGPVVGVISTVENHVRTQMQVDNIGKKRFRNSAHCLFDIVRHHGLGTLFKGWSITTLKDCAYFSTYFFFYEGVKGSLTMTPDNDGYSILPTLMLLPPSAAVPVAGGAAGVMAWLVAYPLDCVRARLQGQCLVQGQTMKTATTKSPNTSWKLLQTLVQHRGWRGLYAGVTPTLVRASLVHSVRFSAYEGILWLFSHHARNQGTE